jgi:hypothetical protein
MTTPESNEMATLSSETTAAQQQPASTSTAPIEPSSIPQPTGTTTKPSLSPLPPPLESEDITATAGPSTTQRKEFAAIGPATEDGHPKADPESGPTVLITLLLTTGRRHPYKIDAKYLRKRNVTVEDNDPWNLPVQALKELILRDWREGELERSLESLERGGGARAWLHEVLRVWGGGRRGA